MRNAILWAGLLLMLGTVNFLIVGKEHILANGDTLLLELAPRDPRSLLQGDYMALRYRLEREIARSLSATSTSGRLVVRTDGRGVARFVRLHEPAVALQAAEHLLYFRKRGPVVRLASDAFFFEEGHERHYAAARYGELRVGAQGDAILVGLRDQDLKPLGPPAKGPEHAGPHNGD